VKSVLKMMKLKKLEKFLQAKLAKLE